MVSCFVKLEAIGRDLRLKMLFAYFVTFVIVVVSWYHKKYHKRNQLLSKIPSMTSYPLIGSSLSFVGNSAAKIFQNLEKASKQHGPLWRFDLSPFKTNIVVHDPKVAEGILSSQKLLEKSDEYNFVRQWLGDGI